MTRLEFSEIIGTLLGYVNTSIKSHPEDVFFVGDQIRGALIKSWIDENGTNSLGQFCVSIPFPVQYDSYRNRRYVNIDNQILGLKDNEGIIQLAMPQDENSSFVGLPVGMESVYANLEAGRALGRKKYWQEGTKIYFDYLDPLQSEVLLKAVPSLFAKKPNGDWVIGYDDQLPQPYEFNDFMIKNARMAFEEQKITKEDNVNDGTAGVAVQTKNVVQPNG